MTVATGAADLDTARRAFADDLAARAPITNAALHEAFASVPREAFCGPPPWRVVPLDGEPFSTSDPKALYADVLVRLDEAGGINNGEPLLWARLLDALGELGGSRVLQIGAGGGYYTAILAECVGRRGAVVAVEADERLARDAGAALRPRPQVRTLAGDVFAHLAAGSDAFAEPFGLIVAFAGATHVPTALLDALAPRGRLLLPLTGADGWGVAVLVSDVGEGAVGSWSLRVLNRCGFIGLTGARDQAAGERLTRAILAGGIGPDQPAALRLVRGEPPANATPLVRGIGTRIEGAGGVGPRR